MVKGPVVGLKFSSVSEFEKKKSVDMEKCEISGMNFVNSWVSLPKFSIIFPVSFIVVQFIKIKFIYKCRSTYTAAIV